MNIITIMGRVTGATEIKEARPPSTARYVQFYVTCQQKGTGAYSDRTYRTKMRVNFYTAKCEVFRDLLIENAWVEAVGEPRAEAWMGKGNKAFGMISIQATLVKLCDFSLDEPHAPSEGE